MTHGALGAGREFDAIREMVSRWGPRARGIGDDASVLDLEPGERLVVSTDSSVEDVHFRRDWLAPDEIGWRATMAGFSDLAGMGARPLGVLVALTVPDSWRAELNEIADGIGDASETVGAPIVGGDLNAAPFLSLGITVLGACTAPLFRSGARPGDELWVTGLLGGPALALAQWLNGSTPSPDVRSRFARPAARIAEGRWLAANGATAAVDLSDGLIADAGHIAAASGVAITVELDLVPRFASADPVQAASSGEEYELLATLPSGFDAGAFAAAHRTPITRIGVVREGAGEVHATLGGARVDVARGYDHFSR